VGPAEVLAAALKQAGTPTLGERTAGLGVERSRIPLRQGGAVELVTRRWVGAGGEKLDRQGVAPELILRGLKPEEDPIPKVVEALEKRPAKGDKKGEAKSTVARRGGKPLPPSQAPEPLDREVV
jgi:carboxyl-terminal processing protease